MIVEVHWYIKDIARGCKKTFRGVDVINSKNLPYLNELIYGRLTDMEVELEELSITEIVSAMDILGEHGHDLSEINTDTIALLLYSETLHSQVFVPSEWGIKFLKFKKNGNSKRAFRVDTE